MHSASFDPASPVNEDDSLVALLRPLLRHFLLAALVAGSVFGLMAFVIFNLKPAYDASALLMLPSAPVDDTRLRGTTVASAADALYLQSEMDFLTSDYVVRMVIERYELAEALAQRDPSIIDQARKWVTRKIAVVAEAENTGSYWTVDELLMSKATARYRQGLGAYNDGRSLTARVSFRASDPRFAATVANAHATVYVDLQNTRRTQAQVRIVDLISAELEARERDVAEAQGEIATARTELDALARDNPAREAAADRLQRLEQAHGTARSNLVQTEAHLSEAESALRSGILQSAEFVATDARILSPALVPVIRAFPRTTLFLAISVVVALGIGTLAAVAAELWAGRGRRVETVLAGLGVHAVGSMVPKARALRRYRDNAALEEGRFVRELLLGQDDQAGGRILLVPLASRTDASWHAFAVAQAIAAAGRSVLHVDADLRKSRPRLRRARSGLADILAGKMPLEKAIVPSGTAGLHRLEPGRDVVSVDTLASCRMATLLESFRKTFEFVIVSGPPLTVSDSLALARKVDAIFLVVDLATPADTIEQAVGLLRSCHVQIAGAILSGGSSGSLRERSRGSRHIASAERPSPAPKRTSETHP